MYRRCPQWDDVDPIFRDRDGGFPDLRGNSARGAESTLMALDETYQPEGDVAFLDPLSLPGPSQPVSWPPTPSGPLDLVETDETPAEDPEEVMPVPVPQSTATASNYGLSISDKRVC